MTVADSKIALMEASWLERLGDEFQKPYMRRLEAFLAQESRNGAVVFPPMESIFSAFCYTPFDRVRVVVVGQDPYHGPGQAHGLSFSVMKGVQLPPSLQNIFKELKSDLGVPTPEHGFLGGWAQQGVLMLNATLTVRSGEPKSHYGQGWETFTDQVVRLLYERADPVVFLLWGKSALEKFQNVGLGGASHHLILTSAHPSPFSAHSGFFGCRHFSKTNEFLKSSGFQPIDWAIH